jgi:hypothetical protein
MPGPTCRCGQPQADVYRSRNITLVTQERPVATQPPGCGSRRLPLLFPVLLGSLSMRKGHLECGESRLSLHASPARARRSRLAGLKTCVRFHLPEAPPFPQQTTSLNPPNHQQIPPGKMTEVGHFGDHSRNQRRFASMLPHFIESVPHLIGIRILKSSGG